MKKIFFISLIILVFFSLTSFKIHKFYVSIYQINFAKETKMLQITSRIFIDDLNITLSKYSNQKTNIGEKSESIQDILILKKYISEHFNIKINNQKKQINYLSKEIEGNVLICYFNIKEVSKIKSITIQNTALLDLNVDQQNIIQTKINGKKQSLLLTNSSNFGIIE